jgi:hypothetical protein
MKPLDATLMQQVLEARSGLLSDYEPIVQTRTQFKQSKSSFHKDLLNREAASAFVCAAIAAQAGSPRDISASTAVTRAGLLSDRPSQKP